MWKCDIFSSLGECIVNVISWEGGKTKKINKPSPTGHFPESLDSLDIHFIQWWSLALRVCQLSLMSFLCSHFRGEKNSYSEKKKEAFPLTLLYQICLNLLLSFLSLFGQPSKSTLIYFTLLFPSVKRIRSIGKNWIPQSLGDVTVTPFHFKNVY